MAAYPERVRTTDGRSYAIVVQEIQGGTPTFTSTGYKVLGSRKTILDNYTRGFRPGRLVVNPVEIRSFEGYASNGVLLQPANLYTGGKWIKHSGPIAGLNAIPTDTSTQPTPISVNRQDAALMRAWAATATPDADVGIMLAEAGRTLSMCVSPFKMFSSWMNQGLRGLSSKVKRNPALLMSSFSDFWLATRFGVLPTISDINALISKFNKGFKRDLNVLRRKSGGSSYDESHVITKTEEPWGVFTTRWKNETVSSTRCNAIVYYSEVLLTDGLGLGVFDIPSLLWESIPFSFVVDWMFGIGTWLRAIQPKPNLRYLQNCVSTVQTTTLSRSCVGARFIGQPWGYRDITTDSVYFGTSKCMRRNVNIPIPVLPQFNPDFATITHGIDALNLIWQRLPKLRS